MLSIIFPNISPVAVNIAGFEVYWYAIAYVVGILGGSYLLKIQNNYDGLKTFANNAQIESFVLWIVIGVIVGGRVGYILFYQSDILFKDLKVIFYIRQGGMSFHGGMIGVVAAIFLYTKKYRTDFWQIIDKLVCVVPLGLFLGRIANFVNGELFGRATNVSWGVIFPQGGNVIRHPSQIYEALSEGVLIFIVMMFCVYKRNFYRQKKLLSGIFCVLYGLSRIVVEFFRQPDGHIGFILQYFTLGQLLSVPILIVGILLIKFCDSDGKFDTK